MIVDRRSVSGSKIIRAADKGVLFACMGAIAAVYILDALFFMAWAPTDYLIPVFMLIGIVIRTIAVFAGVSLQWVREANDIKLARTTVRGLWVLCLLACLVPAMSFFAGGHSKGAEGRDIATAVEQVSTTSKTDRIARIERQIAREEATRDQSVEETNQTIQAILDDGVAGVSDADNVSVANLREEIKGYRAEAATKINAFELQITGIEEEQEAVTTEAAEAENTISPFSAIFYVIGDITGTNPDAWSIGVLFFFALLIEAIAALGLGAYYDIHRAFVRIMQDMQVEEAIHEKTLDEIEGEPGAPEPEIETQLENGEQENAETPEQPEAEEVQLSDDEEAEHVEDDEALPEEEALTPEQQRSRKGGLANDHYSKARQKTTKVPVADLREPAEAELEDAA